MAHRLNAPFRLFQATSTQKPAIRAIRLRDRWRAPLLFIAAGSGLVGCTVRDASEDLTCCSRAAAGSASGFGGGGAGTGSAGNSLSGGRAEAGTGTNTVVGGNVAGAVGIASGGGIGAGGSGSGGSLVGQGGAVTSGGASSKAGAASDGGNAGGVSAAKGGASPASGGRNGSGGTSGHAGANQGSLGGRTGTGGIGTGGAPDPRTVIPSAPDYTTAIGCRTIASSTVPTTFCRIQTTGDAPATNGITGDFYVWTYWTTNSADGWFVGNDTASNGRGIGLRLLAHRKGTDSTLPTGELPATATNFVPISAKTNDGATWNAYASGNIVEGVDFVVAEWYDRSDTVFTYRGHTNIISPL